MSERRIIKRGSFLSLVMSRALWPFYIALALWVLFFLVLRWTL